MRRAWDLFVLLVGALASIGHAHAQTDLPTGKGLPLQVNVAVEFVELIAFKENNNLFSGTVDVRLRWEDLRLRQSGQHAAQPQVFRGSAAEAQIGKMWVPPVEIANQRGRATYTSTGLWLYPDGRVEMMKRISGDFTSSTNVGRFPFDQQKLNVEVIVRDLDSDKVMLLVTQADLNDSRFSTRAALDGWELDNVTLRYEIVRGWQGATYSQVTASLDIGRKSALIAAFMFIPLFASLLIPMLSLWLNRNEDGLFQIETFELTNVIIGGLFAVIALNFTISSSYEVLNSGDNPVYRLLALNYVALAVALIINVLLFRFGVVRRCLGRYVEEQTYFVLAWAVPVITFVTATAIVLSAVA